MIRLKRLYANDFKQLRNLELHFPEAGRILVMGKNEAGKSTLFEAVLFGLFGQALATESQGKPNLDDLIGYEKAKARVELDVTVGDRLFRITRTLNRNKPNVWALDIVSGARVEQVRGNRPVNDRLIAEFGFDGEALLNTCFVEQKKLEKLEGLNRAKREESLSRLLNLERLLEMEESYKLRGEDEKMLSRLRKRVELAQAQEQLPNAERELAEAEQQLKLIELRALIARAAEEKTAAQRLAADLALMTARREELKGAVERVNALEKARHSMSTAIDRFDLIATESDRLGTLVREREETDRALAEGLPALEERKKAIRHVGHQLARFMRVGEARAKAQTDIDRLTGLKTELDGLVGREEQLRTTIAGYDASAEAVDDKLHRYEVGEALGEWAVVAAEKETETVGEARLEEKVKAKEQASVRFRTALVRSGIVLATLVVATLFVPLGMALAFHGVILPLAVGAVLLAVVVIWIFLAVHRAIALWQALASATEEFGELQGEVTARREAAIGYADRLRSAQDRLKALGVDLPDSVAAAQAHRIEIAAKLDNKTRAELQSQRDAVRESMNYARARSDEILRRTETLRAEYADGDTMGLQKSIDKCVKLQQRWQGVLEKRAEALHVSLDLQALRDALHETESQLRTWQDKAKEAPKVASQIDKAKGRISKMQGDLVSAYETARSLLDGKVTPWSESLSRSAYSGIEGLLSSEFEAAGGEQVRGELNSLEKKIGACEREHKMREETVSAAVASAGNILAELGIEDTLGSEPSLQVLQAVSGRFDQVSLDDKTRLEARVKSLHQRVGALKDTRGRLERELSLQGESVDLFAARDELEKEQKNQEERKQAAEIVSRARKRIVQKVLPATMDYMRRILPQLTRDRYHDAELDPETYKIRVWDERAGQSGAWKEKNIFSGGTKDQFSLALRLAFALATLPQERGTSPGFIFLDEPLASFDDERAAALLYLLTEGEIGRAFEQVFLISHVRVQESQFTHRIRMENGVVVEDKLSTRDDQSLD